MSLTVIPLDYYSRPFCLSFTQSRSTSMLAAPDDSDDTVLDVIKDFVRSRDQGERPYHCHIWIPLL